MKWNKALNILIVVFLITNTALGLGNFTKHIAAYRVSDERISNIESILADRDVHFACELPTNYMPIQTVWLEPMNLDGVARNMLVDNLFGKGAEGVKISTKSANGPYEQDGFVYKKDQEEIIFQGNGVQYINLALTKVDGHVNKEDTLELAAVFRDHMLVGDNFKNVKISYTIESYGASVTYYEVYNRLPIFDNYIRIEVTPEGVISAEMQAAKIVEEAGTTKPLNPIDKVLFDIEDHITKRPPLTIENVQLGYSMEDNKGIHILQKEGIPMYKIEVKGLSEPIFVNAYTK